MTSLAHLAPAHIPRAVPPASAAGWAWLLLPSQSTVAAAVPAAAASGLFSALRGYRRARRIAGEAVAEAAAAAAAATGVAVSELCSGMAAIGTGAGERGAGASAAAGGKGGHVSARGGAVGATPLESLQRGTWVKLICGASFEDVVDVRNLALVYTLAGVDCIDCAADPAVVAAVAEGVDAALALQAPPLTPSHPCHDHNNTSNHHARVGDAHEHAHANMHMGGARSRPWLMVSVSDHEDPHFRRAEFNPSHCPPNCARPCERVCPTQAITAHGTTKAMGVQQERCYGCGRCIGACPYNLIRTHSHVRRVEDVCSLLASAHVDAIEIHTLPGHVEHFEHLWRDIGSLAGKLKLVAVSLPDLGEGMLQRMCEMQRTMQPELSSNTVNIWQLDGRPMSGDVGAGTARAAVVLAQRVMAAAAAVPAHETPSGFLQLAGGTNSHTHTAIRHHHLRTTPVSVLGHGDHWSSSSSIANGARGDGDGGGGDGVADGMAYVAGVAFGGYARKIICPFLTRMAEREAQGEPASEAHTSDNSTSTASSDKMQRTTFSASCAGRGIGSSSNGSGRNDASSSSSSSSQLWVRHHQPLCLENHPDLLWAAVAVAQGLVHPLKRKLH